MAEKQEEKQKLGPNVTYNPPEGEPETTSTYGIPFVKGQSVNVVDLLGEAGAQGALKKLSGNRFFKVDGGMDHEKAGKTREEAQEKVDKANEEVRKRREEEAIAASQGNPIQPTNQVGKPAYGKKGETPEPEAPESYKAPEKENLEHQPTRRR